MSKALKIFIPFLIVILFIGGCSQSNSKGTDGLPGDANNDEIIAFIDDSLRQYLNGSHSDYQETIIKDIEKITNSEFIQDSGSGRYVLEFKYNEEISFAVFGPPFDAWEISLNGEAVKES
ncbi:MAG: hypothetical protein J1E36_03200 [Eubacterium sp.]|nr:hypothetical protein [Eubacterium sp.]